MMSFPLLVTSMAMSINVVYVAFGVFMSAGLQLTYMPAFMATVTVFNDNKW